MERTHRYWASSLFLATAAICLNLGLEQSQAGETPRRDRSIDSLYEGILHNYRHENFEEAIRLARKLRARYPESPAGAFALASSYQTLMRNYRIRRYEAKLDSLLDLCVKVAEEAVRRDRRNAMNYFYLGCAYGSRSIYYARRGAWLDAFKYGSRVSKSFETALRCDPNLYDAYYGLGLYNYWLGAKSDFLPVMPFSKKKKEHGIQQIKLAIEKGRFLKIDAMYGLKTVYFNEGEYDKALDVATRLYQRYPKNPSLLYSLGRILQAMKHWEQALTYFNELYAILRETPYQSLSYRVDCLYQMARCEKELGSNATADQYCETAIQLNRRCDPSQELNGPLEDYDQIKSALMALHEEVCSPREGPAMSTSQ